MEGQLQPTRQIPSAAVLRALLATGSVVRSEETGLGRAPIELSCVHNVAVEAKEYLELIDVRGRAHTRHPNRSPRRLQ